MPDLEAYTPTLPLSTGGRPLPEGVSNGTYVLRPVAAGTLEIDIREFIGWWKTEQAQFVRRVKEAKPDRIRLFIASLGGYTSDALAILDFLKMYPARVEVTITGTTASAATIIAMAGDTIRMSDNALFLVHYNRGGLWVWGPIETVEKAADQVVRGLKKHNTVVRNLYRKRTGQSDEDLDELLLLDEWLTASETLNWGFIDEVFEPEAEPVDDDDDATTASASPLPAAIFAAYGLPKPPREGHRPVAGENFAAWSSRLIDAIDEDEDDDRSRSDVITELAEATNLSAGIVRAIINEEDPIDCPFTSAEKFPTPSDSRDAVRKWAGVLEASPRDALSALEADGCSYEDEDDEDEDEDHAASSTPSPPRRLSAAVSAAFKLDIEAMSKPDDAKTKATNTPATPPKSTGGQPASQQPDEAARLQTMQAEIDALKSQNAQLAKERRTAALGGLKRACAGRLPGIVAEALVEYAEAVATLADQRSRGADSVSVSGSGASGSVPRSRRQRRGGAGLAGACTRGARGGAAHG